ncbi:MAG: sulfite exporter TauE/SafE family protein [Candidatus Methylomirabilia bacterium]
MTLAFTLTLVGLGFVGAFVSGLVGIGGAIVVIPLLFYVPPLLGVGSLDIKVVAGVTMAAVLAASLVGAWTHGRAAMVHRPLALIGGATMGLGSLVGAVASRYVSGRMLLAVFAVMSTVALPLMLVPPARGAVGASERTVPFNRVAALACPGLIGLMAGLVGAGGGFLLAPVLMGVMRIPVRVSIGTSLAITVVSALAGFFGKALTGQVPFWPAVAVVLGSLGGAPLGARVSRIAPVSVLRGVLAVLIALIAVRVWADVLTH